MKMKLFLLFSVAFILFAPEVFAAVTCPTGTAPSSSGICIPTSTSTGLSSATVETVLMTFVKWLLYLFAGAALLVFVFAGYQYLVSAGDENQAEAAKNTAKYAIIGLAVTLSALIIIRTVSNLIKATGPVSGI